MGIEAMAITNVIPNGVIPFGSSIGLWAGMLTLLVMSAVGIWLAVPQVRRPAASVRRRHAVTPLLSAEA